MKTDDLILALASDTLRPPSVRLQLVRLLPVAIALTVVAFGVFWGPRPDFLAAVGTVAVLKTIMPLVLVILAGALSITLARPAAPCGIYASGLVMFIAMPVAVFANSLGQAGMTGLAAALNTPQLVTCLLSIPVLAVPAFVAVFRGLSAGAVIRPRLTGFVAGLAAGGLSAAIYSVYCDKDMVLFVVPAYSAAILSIACCGAIVGPRALRW